MKKKARWWTREGMDDLQVSQLAAGLSVLTGVQTELDGAGRSRSIWSEDNSESVRTSFLALLDGVGQVEPHQVDAARVADEFADVLVFLGHVIRYGSVHADLTPRQLAEAYQAKMGLNRSRPLGEAEE